MNGRVVAVCGKGGVGKTTVTAVLVQALARKKKLKALVVDADPAGGLGLALALPVKRSLNQLRRATIQEIKQRRTDARDLAASLDYRLLESLTEIRNLAFLSLGRPEEVGCYCSVNTLLREAIELLAAKFDWTVIDAEAGIEQVNRKVMSAVEYLVVVSDPSEKGLQVAETIVEVARRVSGQEQAGLLLNRVRSAAEVRDARARTRLPLLGAVPEDETIRRFDSQPRSFFELPECPARTAIRAALAPLLQKPGGGLGASRGKAKEEGR